MFVEKGAGTTKVEAVGKVTTVSGFCCYPRELTWLHDLEKEDSGTESRSSRKGYDCLWFLLLSTRINLVTRLGNGG